MSRVEIKNKAKQLLSNNLSWAALTELITIIIFVILYTCGRYLTKNSANYIILLGNLLIYLGSFVSLSASIAFLHFVDDQDYPKKEMPYIAAFAAFTNNRFKPELISSILVTIFTTLWTLLLIIPGIIMGLAYSMTPYIVNDMAENNKPVSSLEAISESRHLMKGHKLELFFFNLSFVGWFLLGIISCGIGLLWIIPYYSTAKAEFYRNLAADQFLK